MSPKAICRVLWLQVVVATCAGAQVVAAPDLCADGPRPAFDVVSVKPSQSPSGRTSMHGTSDGMTYTGTLNRLMLIAYNLHDFQVSGGPGWLSTATWEIHAKSDSPDPDATHLSDAERQALREKYMQEMRSMMADRFHVRCHMSTKEMPVYELTVGKAGSRLAETKAELGKRGNMSSDSHGGVEHASATGVGTDRIAIFLARPTGRLVLDKTGLTGSYDFTLDWVDDAPAGSEQAAHPSSGPTIYTAVEEQLGLHLRPAKGAVPVMVIDQAEMPSEN